MKIMRNKVCLLGGLLLASFTLKAQQTIFNVPSSDITPKRKILAQQQVDFSREEFRSSTTFNYGLGKNWEVGANLYNLEYMPQEGTWLHNDTTTQMPYAPLLLLNAQKVFDLTDEIHVGLGGHTGLNLAAEHHTKWLGFAYANLGGSFKDDRYKLVVGTYTGTRRYLGDGALVGAHLGFDIGIINQKFHVLGDWASGTHEYGQLIVGAEVYLTKHLPLAVGWRRNNENGDQGVVVQLTYTPK